MLKSQADISVGALSDPGRLRFANEDAYRCAQDLGLFIVADGLGGLPSGEAASQVAAHALPRLIQRALNHPAIAGRTPQGPPLGALLRDAMILLNRHMYQQSLATPTLDGMATTVVGLILQGKFAHIVNAGDSRAYLFRRGRLAQMTKDHSREVAHRPPGQGLLTQYLVMPGDVEADINSFALQPDDRILLCSDGLSGPLSHPNIERLLTGFPDPQDACNALIDAANQAGGPDNITAILVHWRSYREGDVPVPAPGDATNMDYAHAENIRGALEDMEKDMSWLLAGIREVSQESPLRALAAAKRLLGGEVYLEHVLRHPAEDPLQVFHQVCASADGAWRLSYEAHKAAFRPLIKQVIDGRVRLSPLLTNDDIARIFGSLLSDWDRVEQRYFDTCASDDLLAQSRGLEGMIQHMTGSARTLSGLCEMLPRMAINLGG